MKQLLRATECGAPRKWKALHQTVIGKQDRGRAPLLASLSIVVRPIVGLLHKEGEKPVPSKSKAFSNVNAELYWDTEGFLSLRQPTKCTLELENVDSA